MALHRDDFELSSELRALRSSPRTAFADELDARVAAGFAKAGKSGDGLLGRIAGTLRNSSPRRLMLPAGAVALTALVVATAVIAISETGNDVSAPTQMVDGRNGIEREAASGGPAASGSKGGQGGFEYSDAPADAAGRPPLGKNSRGKSSLSAGGAGVQIGPTSPTPFSRSRDVERDADLVLLARADEIGDASSAVFAAVHAADGIVLRSSIEDRGADANAKFELLIPSTELSDALSSLSQIADVRSRRESTRDITAPTSGAETRLADSRARIDGLVAQLASAESEEERAAVEAELRSERKYAAVLRAQLDQIRQRADFAEVSLRIESSAADAAGSGAWGVGDALRDAGRILAIAAGVAVVSLAVIGPLALILLLAWLAQRIWLRQRRQRVLS